MINSMKTVILIASIFLFTSCAALNIGGEKETVVIKTNAECGMCKDRLEGDLNYRKGIVFAELEVPTKELTVKYNKAKITLDEIRAIVSEIGYNADDVKANPTAQSNLPACCQPGGMDK